MTSLRRAVEYAVYRPASEPYGFRRKILVIPRNTMKTVVRFSIGVFTLGLQALIVPATYADGDAAEGRKKAETCLGCHAAINIENAYPMYRVPKVAGQHPEYIVAALNAYRSGERPHKTMQANAANLTDEDIADIAAYFAEATK